MERLKQRLAIDTIVIIEIASLSRGRGITRNDGGWGCYATPLPRDGKTIPGACNLEMNTSINEIQNNSKKRVKMTERKILE